MMVARLRPTVGDAIIGSAYECALPIGQGAQKTQRVYRSATYSEDYPG